MHCHQHLALPAISTASHTVDAWQKQALSFRAAWLYALCVALKGFVPMACIEENDVMFSFQTKHTIYLSKTPFHQNHNLSYMILIFNAFTHRI